MSDKYMRSNADVPKCNLCGESCMLERDAYGDGTNDCSVGGLIDCEVMGGYDSTPGNGKGALDDMTSYRFSLCEFCRDWLFRQFKTPPKIDQHIQLDEGMGAEVFRPADQRVEEDDRRGMKREIFVEARLTG